MAAPDPTRRPPDVGKNVPVRVTPDMYDDLATLMRNGTNASDAIRAAVRHLAFAYRRTWLHGTVPVDQDPAIRQCPDIAPARQTPMGEPTS